MISRGGGGRIFNFFLKIVNFILLLDHFFRTVFGHFFGKF